MFAVMITKKKKYKKTYLTPFAPYLHVAFDYFTPAVVKGGHRTRIGTAPYYAPFTLYVHVAFDYFTSAVVYP